MIDIENRIETAEDDLTELKNRIGVAEAPMVFTMSDKGATYLQR